MKRKVCSMVMSGIALSILLAAGPLSAQEQKKTLRIANGGTRITTTRQLQGVEIIQYQLAAVDMKKKPSGYFVTTIEEFDARGRFIGGSGTFIHHLSGGKIAKQTYDTGRNPNKTSRRGLGTLGDTTATFSEADSDQMEAINEAIKEVNNKLKGDKVATNGFLVFMSIQDRQDVTRSEQLATLAKKARGLDAPSAAQRIGEAVMKAPRSEDRAAYATSAFLQLIGLEEQ